MNTEEYGDHSVGQAVNYFMSHWYEVCLPIEDKRDYDLVVKKNGALQKVQVKYAGIYTASGVCKVGLRITGGNQSFHSTKKYSKESFDLLFIYTAKRKKCLLPWNMVTFRNELSIESEKYRIYRC
jgi:hypothetical protein